MMIDGCTRNVVTPHHLLILYFLWCDLDSDFNLWGNLYLCVYEDKSHVSWGGGSFGRHSSLYLQVSVAKAI